MSATMQNGRAMTEVTTPPGVDAQALIPRADMRNHNLALIRVQSDATARRGRGLVRFITDLVQREDKPIPVVAECSHCGRFYNVEVDLSDAKQPVVRRLPGNCRRCLTPIDTPAMIDALVRLAHFYRDTATPVGAA